MKANLFAQDTWNIQNSHTEKKGSYVKFLPPSELFTYVTQN